jgi:hypothetical protein
MSPGRHGRGNLCAVRLDESRVRWFVVVFGKANSFGFGFAKFGDKILSFPPPAARYRTVRYKTSADAMTAAQNHLGLIFPARPVREHL